MYVDDLKEYFDNNRDFLTNQIRKSESIPQPIRGKDIPKGNKKFRTLGIPTVIDRMIQQAVLRVIMPHYDISSPTTVMAFVPNETLTKPSVNP